MVDIEKDGIRNGLISTLSGCVKFYTHPSTNHCEAAGERLNHSFRQSGVKKIFYATAGII